jgi:hypothetical protein
MSIDLKIELILSICMRQKIEMKFLGPEKNALGIFQWAVLEGYYFMTMSIVNIPSLLPSYIINRPSPSARDGISIEVEKYQRIYGCELIQQSGIILNLNQVVMVTAQNILNRFYYRLSPSSMFYIYFDYNYVLTMYYSLCMYI